MQVEEGDPVPMLNLKAQYTALKTEIDGAISDVLSSQHFILGENVTALEGEIAEYCHTSFAVGVASGTDALILALRAAGVGAGDEVIVPAFSFIATADSVSALGATPVFVDIDPVSFTIAFEFLSGAVTERTKAIIPVHLYGQSANMREIRRFATKHDLRLVGDSAQALGATYQGEPLCSFEDFGCISFFPSKNLGAYGDAGMITTNDEAWAAQLRMLRSHGSSKKYYSEMQGWNSRLDEIQAAILRVKLPHLDRWNLMRADRAALYTEVLSGIEGVVLPSVLPGRTHVFHQYTVRVQARDEVQAELLRRGVQSAVHYPTPLPFQPMYEALHYREGDFPVAEKASREVLSLPMNPDLSDAQITRVGAALQDAVQSRMSLVAGYTGGGR